MDCGPSGLPAKVLKKRPLLDGNGQVTHKSGALQTLCLLF